MSDNHIGIKITFWKMIAGEQFQIIRIPTIQRDYTYGAETDETEKVLNNLLSGLKCSLFDGDAPEMTLNFVYGYTEEGVNYIPLDGQQRLTTLFLLHYYASLFVDNSPAEPLERFTYATRETTKNYCKSIIEFRKDIAEAARSGEGVAATIAESPWYIPAYDNDPSVRSMQYVMGRIEETFCDVRAELWARLTGDDCRVNYYLLDFGPFSLSDDLYVKMNSRGKKLTEYEIFKSLFLKHVEKTLGDTALASDLAIRFDNAWTDMVWSAIGKPLGEEERKEIDRAYVRLLKLLLTVLSYRHGELAKDISTEGPILTRLVDTLDAVRLVQDFFDTWEWASQQPGGVEGMVNRLTAGLRSVVKKPHAFGSCLRGENLTHGDLMLLMGEYFALRLVMQDAASLETAKLRLRHLRNLIENSANELRPVNMGKLLQEVEEVMVGKLSEKESVAFNTNQWKEECEKERHVEIWQTLFDYEEHQLLLGALSNFAPGQLLDLSNPSSRDTMFSRLNKFNYLFDDKYMQNDQLLRKALLTLGDYTQWENNRKDFRILGNVPASWRGMFVKSIVRKNQEVIMTLLDGFRPNGDVTSCLNTLVDNYLRDPTTDKTDWRYYAVKYASITQGKAYGSGDYGYYYVPNTNGNTLQAVLLRSSQFGISNVAWMLLNLILYERNAKHYNLSLNSHAADEDEEAIYLQCDRGRMQLTITSEGWRLSGAPNDLLLRIDNAVFYPEQQYWLITPDKGSDYIDWAEHQILANLTHISGFAKTGV